MPPDDLVPDFLFQRYNQRLLFWCPEFESRFFERSVPMVNLVLVGGFYFLKRRVGRGTLTYPAAPAFLTVTGFCALSMPMQDHCQAARF